VTAPRFIWPVYGFSAPFKRETVATFFDWSAAVDFVHASERNLYLAEPRYDRRAA